MVRERRETIIAVNFGGCIVPTGLAVYELLHLSAAGASALLALLVTAGVNIAVCYFVARPWRWQERFMHEGAGERPAG
jgi:uncharacterized membrane protein